MIRSVTLIHFKAGTDARARAAVRAAYQDLPAQIPQLRSISAELDAGLLEGAAGIAVIAEFASREDFLAYAQHPAQSSVIYPVCGPVLASYSTLQYEV
jgi:hypothetical protein